MVISYPYALNTGSTISGTTQIGSIAIGITEQNYENDYGGLKWWMGPDENLGYMVALPDLSVSQSTPSGINAGIEFLRSTYNNNESFINLTNSIARRYSVSDFTNISDAYNWLKLSGFSTSYLSNYLTLTILSDTSIRLDWTDINDFEHDGYSIERSSDGISYSEIDTVSSGVNTYTDTVAVGDYYYQVRPYSGAVYSLYSNVVYVDTSLITGLVNSYSFDEVYGNLIDGWGTNDGVRTNVDQEAEGKLGYAYSWSGTGKVTLTAEHSFLSTDNITVDFWYKPVSVSAAYMIFDRTLNVFSVVQAYQNLKDFSFRIRGSNNVGLTTVTYTNAIPVAGVWYHIICERNVSNDNINLWVNGVPWGTPVTDATTSGFGPITLKFGASQGESNYMLNGNLDELHIWKGLLGDTEKAKLYNNGLGISVVSPIDYGGTGLSAELIPTGLTAEWIDNFARISFTDRSSGTAQHEIWESKDGGDYVLAVTLDTGVTTYDYETWQNASLNFKVRAKIGDDESGFTPFYNIVTPWVFKMSQLELTEVSIDDIHLYATNKSVVIDWDDETSTTVTATTTNAVTKNYTSTGVYYVKLSGNVDSINFFDWQDQASILSGTSVTKWVLPDDFQASHLKSNDFVGDMSDIRYPPRLTFLDIDNNYLTWNLTNFYHPPLLFEFNASTKTYNNTFGDISTWVLGDNIAHINVHGYIWGDLTNLDPFRDTYYGNHYIHLSSSHPVGLTGDLSGWTMLDLPGHVEMEEGTHFTKMPRGEFRQITNFYFYQNSCDSSEIDSFLQYVDNYFTLGVVPTVDCTYTLNGTGMGIPSATGLSAKSSIEGKYTTAGFTATITVNS